MQFEFQDDVFFQFILKRVLELLIIIWETIALRSILIFDLLWSLSTLISFLFDLRLSSVSLFLFYLLTLIHPINLLFLVTAAIIFWCLSLIWCLLLAWIPFFDRDMWLIETYWFFVLLLSIYFRVPISFISLMLDWLHFLIHHRLPSFRGHSLVLVRGLKVWKIICLPTSSSLPQFSCFLLYLIQFLLQLSLYFLFLLCIGAHCSLKIFYRK
jgi:hypothetical protein